jgi:hypothetical protein
MLETIGRFWAFLVGDGPRAEALQRPTIAPTPDWIRDISTNKATAAVGFELAAKSIELADGAVDSLQSKVSTHLTLLVALVPFALGATAIATPPVGSPPQMWVPMLCLLAADMSLAAAIAVASLASGLTQSGGISLDRLGQLATQITGGATSSEASLRAAATEALRIAAMYAYSSGARVAQDLFTVRRFTLIAVLLAIIGLSLLAVTGGLEALVHSLRTPPPTKQT